MSTIPFLNNRQIGFKSKSSFRLNLDNVISRLVCHKKDIFSVEGEEAYVPPFACKFRRDAQSDTLAVCDEDGDIFLFDTSRKYEEPLIKKFSAHRNAIFDICWVPDKCHLISGSGDHIAMLWDIAHCKCVSVFKQHIASIKSVDVCCEQSALFATGSRDGNINVWDTRTKATSGITKPVITICQAHGRKNTVYKGKKCVQKNPISSVSAVAFQDSNNLASAGVADGVVKIWDLRRTYVPNSKYLPLPRYQMEYSDSGNIRHGCTSLVFDSRYKTLYACSTSHKILKFDCHSYVKEDVEYEGFQCSTYFVKLDLSNDDEYLLCGSSDENAYIWKTSKPGLPIVQLASHAAEVTSVCWSPYDITKLVTCGDDFKVAIWRMTDIEPIKININENVHASAEPYCKSPNKGKNPYVQNTVWPSISASRVIDRKSVVESVQTPNKSASRVITNFFSPLTLSSSPASMNHIQNLDTVNNNSPNTISKLPNKNIAVDVSSQILTPCNHVNKSNHQSPEGNSEVQSSREQNSSPELKCTGIALPSSSISIQNKENSSTELSPESAIKTESTCQTKRKVTSRQSTPVVKRKRIDSSKKSKGLLKGNSKTTPTKTIMNYFSVMLCSANVE